MKLKKPRLRLVLRRINGASMQPALMPGQLIVGIKGPQRLQAGMVVIFWHNGLEKIKRITKIDDEKLYLRGDNVESSTDSRSFGWVDTSAVIARVLFH